MSTFTARNPPPPERGPAGPITSTADAYRVGADGALTLSPVGGERRLARWLQLHHGSAAIRVGLTAIPRELDVSDWAARAARALADTGRGTVFVDLTRSTDHATLAAVASGRFSLDAVQLVEGGARFAELSPGRDIGTACQDVRVLDARLPHDVDVIVLALPEDQVDAERALPALERVVVLTAAGRVDSGDLEKVIGRLAGQVTVDVALLGEPHLSHASAPPPAKLAEPPSPRWGRIQEADATDAERPSGPEEAAVPDEPQEQGVAAPPAIRNGAIAWTGTVQPAADKHHSVSPVDVWTRSEEHGG